MLVEQGNEDVHFLFITETALLVFPFPYGTVEELGVPQL